ncbi:two-component system sensor histidine kinase CreC [Endozoicomonas sp. G2_1]|uniref:two-component system sensor histidine kinase CreC n=1 Tax=Endozoicomonas sp. G2_1 TaxID=2821091 RepID=UPI001ADD5A8A|nr:two-component system sensor histidine kinase CreC [Endozoicomonas sp. G2_1]MBO9489893.1 two-component system sensor histidine kinase CreC [Endozoicomonas sp. G2_1]
MSLTLRIFLAYFVIAVAAGAIFLNVFMSELKPGMRQSSEDSLVDMANLLAELVAPEFVHSPEKLQTFTPAVAKFLERKYKAEIFSVNKRSSVLRVYITDAKGIVRYDSSGIDIGANYSRWNDVYLTLRGRYGARSTKSDPDDEFSTVMHVAAPIVSQGKIVGVLTVAKPNFSVQPFIDIAYQKVIQQGLVLIVLSLIVALSIAYLLTRSIRRLVTYADNASRGTSAQLPKVHEAELSKLAISIENMRVELEGKDYVEKYVHALTHELKSPIAAIKGASELLSPHMPEVDQAKFIDNIGKEVDRMDNMVNRLLGLVAVEKQEALNVIEPVDVQQLCLDVIASKQVQLDAKKLVVELKSAQSSMVQGDGFLLNQAIDNLIQNAIEFANPDSEISVLVGADHAVLNVSIIDQGALIPDYALARVFDRFYSLPRPNSDDKSSGLGLCFVKQIATLHAGRIQLENTDNGVKAVLSIKR